MTYVEDVCLALIRALDHAVFQHEPVTLAGFAANIDFWADEIRHCLDCLAGYDRRFESLRAARLQEAEKWKTEVDPVLINPTISQTQLDRLQKRLHQVAVTFLRACRPHIEPGKQAELEGLLGFRIQDHRPLN